MAAISSVNSKFTTGATEIKGSITAISFSGLSTAEIDVTDITSTNKTYVMGTLDGGTVEVTVNVDTLAATGAPVSTPTAGDNVPTSFVLRLGGGAASLEVPTFSFSAYIQSVSVEAAVDQQVTATYTLRITGGVTISSTPLAT
jgi:hypothetical protein